MAEAENLDDPFGLLERLDGPQTTDKLPSPLVSRFIDLREFVEKHAKLPDYESSLYGRQLRQWFESLRFRDDLLNALRGLGHADALEKFEQLAEARRSTTKLSDPFGLLGSLKTTGIQNLRNVSKVVRDKAEKIARRSPCPNFEVYAPIFEGLEEKIQTGQLVPHTNPNGKLEVGTFVILHDLFGYVAQVESETQKYNFASGGRQREDGRTLVVFENGTQSDLLLRSLEKAIISDGYYLEARESSELDEALSFGFLYVVESAREIDDLKGASKIGFTRSSVEKRLAKAKTESAYLFGEVNVAATYRCIGFDPAVLESMLHAFFSEARLDIEINLGSGNSLAPKEWFRVSTEEISRAVFLAIDSELQNYEYKLGRGIRSRDGSTLPS